MNSFLGKLPSSKFSILKFINPFNKVFTLSFEKKCTTKPSFSYKSSPLCIPLL